MLSKFLFLVCDPWPMVFMGDSGTYIHSAFAGGVPEDRSFFYGILVRVLAVWPKSFYFLVVIQTAASTVTAVLLAWVLREYFHERRSIAFWMGALFAFDPLQLMYERFVMTETFSLLVFAAYCILTFKYLRTPTLFQLILLQAIGVVLISLRLSFLLPVLVDAFLIPLLGALVLAGRSSDALANRSRVSWSLVRSFSNVWVKHSSICILATFIFHGAYQSLNGFLSRKPPAYQYNDGFWLISVWAPVIIAQDSPHPQIASLINRGTEYGLRNIYVRNGQRFSSCGLVGRLREIEPDTFLANRYAKEIALNALKRDPIGVAKLALETYLQFWRSDIVPVVLRDDEGFGPGVSSQDLETVARRMNVPASTLRKITPTKKLHSLCAFWYQCLLQTPLVALFAAIVCHSGARASVFFLLFTSIAIFVTLCALSTQPVFRYLHPFSFIFLLSVGIALDGLLSFRRRDLLGFEASATFYGCNGKS